MNDQARLSIWDRSPIVRALRWLCSCRGVRRMLIILAWTATIIALLYGEENWRGWHAWNKYRQELVARGEQLDYRAFIPAPVPDGQNFAATPLVKSWFIRGTNGFARLSDNYSQVETEIVSLKTKNDGGNRHFMDLVAWGMAFDALRSGSFYASQNGRWITPRTFESDKLDRESRAKAAPSVLEGVKTNEAVYAELRAASQRPYCRYPVVYDLDDPWAILLPHLDNVRSVVRRLGLKACAELTLGRSEDALEDTRMNFYMTDSVKDEPFLISYLVRIACLQLMVQPIWEGLAEHAWSDAQLQEIQQHLQSYNFVADLKRALDGERAAGALTADLVRKKGLGYLVALSNTGSTQVNDRGFAYVVGLLVPSGWYYQEELNYCRLFQVQLGRNYDVTRRTVSPGQVESSQREFEQMMRSSRSGTGIRRTLDHELIAAVLLPALGRVTIKAATAQTLADQAALACALERYRLANGQFPERLDALVPGFITQLPHDVITGAPYKYRRIDGGQFVLWSVGWNEKDDGGVPGKTLFDEKQGDWVWQYPEVP